MNDSGLERMRAEMQHERETRIRPLDVRRPDGRGAAYSGGVELDFELSAQGGTTIDTNPGELRAWAFKMLAFLDEIDPTVLNIMAQRFYESAGPDVRFVSMAAKSDIVDGLRGAVKAMAS